MKTKTKSNINFQIDYAKDTMDPCLVCKMEQSKKGSLACAYCPQLINYLGKQYLG